VVIADDQTLVRGGFRLILNSAGISVVAEAADGKEAVAAALSHQPDVVLMDTVSSVTGRPASRSRDPHRATWARRPCRLTVSSQPGSRPSST